MNGRGEIKSLRSVRIKVIKVIKVTKDVKDIKDINDFNDLSDIVLLFQKKTARWRSFFSGSVDIILLVGGGLFAEEWGGVFAGSVEGGEFFYYSGTVGCVGYAKPA